MDAFEAGFREFGDVDWEYAVGYLFADYPHGANEKAPIEYADVVTVPYAWAYSEDDGGATMGLEFLAVLRDGRWAYCTAACDYTGWGCEDFIEWFVGTRDHVVSRGMDLETRRRAGLLLPGELPGVEA